MTKSKHTQFNSYREMILTRSNGFQSMSGSNFQSTMQSIRAQTCKPKTFRSSTAVPSNRQSMNSEQMSSMMNPSNINDIKPKLLEMKITESENFFRVSDGFKKIFSNDKKDSKLVIPICGYGGHRRGDRSQNYFGKAFRDETIQAKRL